MPITDQDLVHLRTALALAREAYDAGDQPFGTVLVDADGAVLWSGRNHAGAGDETRHPELAAAQWSARLAREDRARCTVYTSGEHCAMCSAAHGWMGLGRIVYALSGAQLLGWRRDWGGAEPVVSPLSINDVAPYVPVDGPAPELEDELRKLHRAAFGR